MNVSTDVGAQPIKKHEGKVTQMIEARTSRVPSGAYLSLAFGSIIAAAAFQIAGKRETANFIGQWAPTLLVIGLYNKVVKLEDELLGMRGGEPYARAGV